MIESILGIVKVWIITRALTNPVLWIGMLGVFSALLLFLAIFVKFKNGYLSLACFILFEAAGVVAIASLWGNNVYSDNLQLQGGEVQQINTVKPNGVVCRKRFVLRTTPLLGISLPEKDSPYFSQARDKILNSRFQGRLYVYTSSSYSGVVLCNAESYSLNEQLLREGLASTTRVSPKQYVRLQTEAVQNKRGMWQVAAAPKKASDALVVFSEIWLRLILCVGIAIVLAKWLTKQIKKLKIHSSGHYIYNEEYGYK